ncbi:hypothetical protein BGZ46_001478 [Entomortierella lignicola]|nr:hypothetical protein BGZ46_001478 [Entomortierella lignicola]
MGTNWKREVVQDHKFDFINVDDFVDNSCWQQFRYFLVFAAIIRGILVYCSDIFTAGNLLANSNESSFVPKTGLQLELFGKLPFEVYKYLFSGCILLGFLLLGLEIWRARAIVKSRDISYAFTSLIASRYYTVRSYSHFCFFSQINNSKKSVDEVAFFCFFVFRNWKRLILADAPRQVINATILYQTFRGHAFNLEKDGVFDWDSVVTGVDGDRLLLKKISIGELIRKKSKTRAADEAWKNGKETALGNMKQPTLPQVDILEASVDTPRTVYVQIPKAQYQAQTPKRAYSYSQRQQQEYQHQLYWEQYQQQRYQEMSQSDVYDYSQATPEPTTESSTDLLNPYVDSAFTSEIVYDHYPSEKRYLLQSNVNQGQNQNQSGYEYEYGYSNPYAQFKSTGERVDYYNNHGYNNDCDSPSYSNSPPSWSRQHEEYRPRSHGSNLIGSMYDNACFGDTNLHYVHIGAGTTSCYIEEYQIDPQDMIQDQDYSTYNGEY